MSDNTSILLPSAVSKDVRGEVPSNVVYLNRITGAKVHVTEKTGNQNIEFTAEIFAPDVVPGADGRPVNVAGRKATGYIPITTSAGNYDNAFLYLGKLQLLEENGGFVPDKVIAAMNAGNVFYQGFMFTEQDFVKHPVTKEPIVVNGQKIPAGWRSCLIDHSHIIGRCAPPQGFEAPKF